MKKILAVIPSLTMGGAEKAFVVWVQALKDLGHEVIVATTQEEVDFFLLPEGVDRYSRRTPQAPSGDILAKLWGLFTRITEPYFNARFLRWVIRKTQVDIVIAHLPKSAIPALLAGEKEKIPCLVMEHLYQEKIRDPILNFLRPTLYPWAKGLVVLTPAMQELFKPYNTNIVQIANPIAIPSSIPSFNDKKKIILLAGRLTAQKQFKSFVEHLKGFDLQDWQVWIAGVGEEREAIESLIKEYQLTNSVHLLGAVSNMAYLYAEASLFVLCSEREGFSLVLAESALYGCVRVSFACPTGPEIMIKDGKTGYLVEDQNWSALFERISELMKNEEKRREFYEASLEPLEAFEPRKVALAWDKLIHEVSL